MVSHALMGRPETLAFQDSSRPHPPYTKEVCSRKLAVYLSGHVTERLEGERHGEVVAQSKNDRGGDRRAGNGRAEL